MFFLFKLSTVMIMASWAVGIGEFYMDGQNYSLAPFEKMFDRQRSFVMDAWKIPKSWINPSMVLSPEDPNKVVIVWRMPDKGRHDKIGYMWLNRSSWEAVKGYDMIEITKPGMWRTYLLGEDARIFNHFGRIHIVYNNHLTRFKRLYYTELWYNAKEDMFHALDPANHVIFENEINIRHQKNWSPFDFCPRCAFRGGSAAPNNSSSSSQDATLLFVYGIQPHTIVLAYNTTKVGEMTAKVVFKTSIVDPDVWKWGEMRGGTPALLVGDSYLSFFHSSGRLSHKHVITYVMGAYLFSREPPFAITHISPEPIFHQTFINESYGWAYKVIDYIVFPMGFVFDDDFIYVSYGKNDKDGWILKLNRTGFFNSLRPVRSKVIGRSDWDRRTGKITRGSYQSALLSST